MKSKRISFGVVCAAVFGFSGAAYAECTTDVAKDDLTDAQVVEIYECIKGELRAGYTAMGDERAAAYPSWGSAATVPGGIGNHGSRFLTTFVNDTGYLEYVRFKDADVTMPVGTVIAKESFNVNKKGIVKRGPLFFMEKVAAGEADEFGNWVYSALQPKGKPMKIKQKFCNDCHVNFADQDSLGYPEEDYRITVFAN
ncbi:MAG: cytochrome P460 family protein [Proteobacteria bacterium]|nr:cytochrome P460 family protein [Pseudomonadota bacterium]